MNRIFLPIEIKVREFHAKLLFALFAAERGFQTVLGGQHELIARMPRLGQGLYIDKSTSTLKAEWFRRCRAMGNYVAAWDEEGLLYMNDEVYHITRMHGESFALTDVFFAWGPKHVRTVLSRYPEAANRVVAAGNPRIDLLRPEFRGYCDEKVAELRRKYGRMLLINTNFPLHNFAKGRETAAKIFESYPLKNMVGLLEEWERFQRVNYEAFMDASTAIHDRYPRHTIVIRPAPAEDIAPWQRHFAGKSHGLVSKEGNVVEWIRAADAVVQFNCTTGIEAFLLGVPSIAYRCAQSALFDPGLVLACSREVFTLEDLLRETDRSVALADSRQPLVVPPSHARAMLADHLTAVEGATACERILDDILRRDFPDRPCVLPAVPWIKRAWRAWLRVVRRPDPADERFYREKFPGLTLAETRAVAAGFARATGRFGNARITSAGSNIVRIAPA